MRACILYEDSCCPCVRPKSIEKYNMLLHSNRLISRAGPIKDIILNCDKIDVNNWTWIIFTVKLTAEKHDKTVNQRAAFSMCVKFLILNFIKRNYSFVNKLY